MKRLLYISNRLKSENQNGAYLASKRNYDLLLMQNLIVEESIILRSELKLERIVQNLFYGRLDISINEEKKIINKLKQKKYDFIFFDGSSFGYLSEKIKKYDKNIKVITFCHDINYYFYSSLLKLYKKELSLNTKSLYQYLRLKKLVLNAEINEKKIFKNSDIIITFNKRDSQLLKKKYNKNSTKEIPMSFNKKKLSKKNFFTNRNMFRLLFVGIANHSPNIEGIKFFINNVILNIDSELIIVGKGMEKYKKEFEQVSKNIKVIGTVEKLDKYYEESDAVISPIFSGGGMKIKTGEALSYGKTIFGTSEAFEGYEVDYQKVGGICNSADEFIKSINNYIEWWKNNNKPIYNEYSYKIFNEKYSYEASIEKFKEIFEKFI